MPRPFFASYLTISQRCHTMTASKAGDSREPNIEAVGRPQRRAKSQGFSPRLCYWGRGMRFLSGRRSRPGWRERRDYWWKVCSRRAYGATYLRWALRAAAISFFILSSTLWLVGLFLGTRADRALSLAPPRPPYQFLSAGPKKSGQSSRSH